MRTHLRIVALLVLFTATSSAVWAQNLNPLDKDSEIRKLGRELDKSRLKSLPDFQNETRFIGMGKVVKGWTSLRNLGKSDYYGSYLDIDGGKGTVLLERKYESGACWKVSKDNDDFSGFSSYALSNLGKSDYYGYYLDITQEGNVILDKRRGSGTHWFVRKVDDRDGVPAYVIQNLGKSPYFGWFLDISGREGAIMLSHEPTSGCFWYLTNEPRRE